MTDLRIAATALLDTPGVHPWDGWEDAYNKFFELIKETTVEGAMHGTLDYIQAEHGHKDHVDINDLTRVNAQARFWGAFNGSRQRRPVKDRIKENASALAGKAKRATSQHKEGGSQ